jgi:putative ABC transport system substrate-binding protein
VKACHCRAWEFDRTERYASLGAMSDQRVAKIERRRLICGAGLALMPGPARSQRLDRMRHIGVLMNLAADDPESQRRVTAFVQALQQFDWTDGRNVQIEYRFGAGDAGLFRKYAAELVALTPDVILATGTPVMDALQQATRTVPVVFVTVIDPVGAGFVESLARPGGNSTGFTLFEYGTSGKWLELLEEMTPGTKRVAVLRDSTIGSGTAQLAAIQALAPSLGVDLHPIGVRNADEITLSVTAFANSSGSGLIVTASTLALLHRQLIITLAERHRLPAVFGDRTFVRSGGLLSYGPDRVEPFRRAADYVNRILKGDKVGELPVQAPTAYELAINLKTARALGLNVPASLLARASEVIE